MRPSYFFYYVLILYPFVSGHATIPNCELCLSLLWCFEDFTLWDASLPFDHAMWSLSLLCILSLCCEYDCIFIGICIFPFIGETFILFWICDLCLNLITLVPRLPCCYTNVFLTIQKLLPFLMTAFFDYCSLLFFEALWIFIWCFAP